MTTLYSQGKGRNVSLPIASNTAYKRGDLLTIVAGKAVPVTNFSNAQAVIGICNEDIAQAASGAKGTTLAFVPRERYVEFIIDFDSSNMTTPEAGVYGVEYGLSDAQTLDISETGSSAVYARYIDTVEYNASLETGKAIVQIQFDGQY